MKMESRMTRYGARLLVSIVVMGILVTSAPARLQAQTPPKQKLSEVLPNLYSDAVVTDFLALISVLPPGTLDPSILTDELLRQVISTPIAVNALAGVQVSSFPLGSSAGGFSWTFDPAQGTFSRVTQSFGPVFAERALTVGRNRLNVGVNYQRATFDSLQDHDLQGGDLKIYPTVPLPGSPVKVVFENALDLKLNADTVGLFATYGITDRLDIGIAVPIVHVSMNARLDTRVAATGTTSPVPFGNTVTGDPVKESATGIGDIVVRGKYGVLRKGAGGVAAGVDLRLPTGDELDLLGVAGTQGKIYVAASNAYGKVSPHVNFGYTFSGESADAKSADTFVFAPPDEFGFVGGVDVAVSPKLTLLGDITTRSLRDFFTISDVAGPISGTSTVSLDDGTLNTALGSVGVKYNLLGSNLVSFNLLFPLNKNGLRDNLTWLVGFERSFAVRK
jgi:hypothetical protein